MLNASEIQALKDAEKAGRVSYVSVTWGDARVGL